ncbi:MAG: hypothetical protein WKF40_05275 [Thermoleophilaceae bacterium]
MQSRRLADNDQAVLARLFLLGVGRATPTGPAASNPPARRARGRRRRSSAAGDGLVRSPIRISPFEGVLSPTTPR